MKTLLEGYLDYLKRTPEDQVKKDWEFAKSKSNYGPTIDDFINFQTCMSIEISPPNNESINFNIKVSKPEKFFGFFF